MAPLREAGNGLLVGGKVGPVGNLERLGRNLKRAAKGVAPAARRDLRSDPGRGAAGRGLRQRPGGGAALASGLATATAGSEEAVGALDQFAEGEEAPEGRRRNHEGPGRSAGRGRIHRQDDGRPQHQHPQQRAASLAETAEKTDEDGARRTRRAETPAEAANKQLQAALQQLQTMTVGKTDPNYNAALDAVRQASAAVSGTAPVTGRLYAKLQVGLNQGLRRSCAKVSFWFVTAIKEIEANVETRRRTRRRPRGTDGRRTKSSRRAAANSPKAPKRWPPKAETRRRARQARRRRRPARDRNRRTRRRRDLAPGRARRCLQPNPIRCETGLRRGAVRVTVNADEARGQTDQLRHQSPGIFDSGYFVLSALDGANAAAAPPGDARRSTSKRRPGGDGDDLHPLHLQHARLDRAQQDARRRSRRNSPTKPASPPGSPAAPRSSTSTAR